MISYFQTKHYYPVIIFWCYWHLIFINKLTHSQYIYQSLSVVSRQGTRFSPASISAQFISATFVDSWKLCAAECNRNPFCRVYDYGSMAPNQCLLFEGDIGILGSIIPSSLPESMVGSIQIVPSLFTQYGQPCSSVCMENRYLICNGSSICDCMPHFYWNVSTEMCLAQMTIPGAPCDPSMNMCREDLNLACSPMDECIGSGPITPPIAPSTTPPTPVFTGTTIVDRSTIIEGSLYIGLEYPVGITVCGDNSVECLILIDSLHNEVIRVWNDGSGLKNISVLARNWTDGDSLNNPTYLFLDTNNQNDLYVADSANQRVVLFSSMQDIAPLPRVVAGITGFSGSALDMFVVPNGVAVDSQKNLYVADNFNHRIMLWALNASSGIMIAGTGSMGNGSMELQHPTGLFLDEYNSLLYVADKDNHRIQSFVLNGTPPYNGTTVAGGNGAGSGNHQLYQPSDVWVSNRTGAIYIADSSNHRIQRWNQGAENGNTIGGNPNGNPGSDATKLSSPLGLTVSKDETRMYISDVGNGRIQRFDHI